MKKLWMYSTIVLMVQFAAATFSFLLISGNVRVAFLVATGVAFAMWVVQLFWLVFNGKASVHNGVAFMAVAMTAGTLVFRGPMSGPSLSSMFAILIFSIAAAVFVEKEEGENIFPCFITVLPGGIVFGGAILLYRQWQRHRQASTA